MNGRGDPVSAEEFDTLFRRCSNWRRWGSVDTKGALNHVGSEQLIAAAALVRAGVAVPCGRTLATEPAIDNPSPALHYLTRLPSMDNAPESRLGVASDFIGLECHGEVQSHLDALCHIAFDGQLYNGWPADSVTMAGAAYCGLEVASHGIISRGVLLDIAALHDQRWLPGRFNISGEDLAAAEAAAGVTVRKGDIVLIRTGQALRREVDGPWDAGKLKAGLHPRAMPWLKDRDIAALGFDGDGECEPHGYANISAPIHVLGIAAMGLHFFDALTLEMVAAECAQQQRSEFMFAALPVQATGATGCAVNPVAIF
jgi:kynurenine formamidase